MPTEEPAGPDPGGDKRAERKPAAQATGTLTQLSLALSIPTLLVSGPLVGFGLGWLMRRWFGWPEWVSYLMVLVGLVAGIRETIKVIRRLTPRE